MVGIIDPATVNPRRSVQSLLSMMNRAPPVAGPLVERTGKGTFRLPTLIDKFLNLPATRPWAFLRDLARKRSFRELKAPREPHALLRSLVKGVRLRGFQCGTFGSGTFASLFWDGRWFRSTRVFGP